MPSKLTQQLRGGSHGDGSRKVKGRSSPLLSDQLFTGQIVEMLDCCQPLERVKKFGITLAEFSCLAKCNGLEATTKFANETFVFLSRKISGRSTDAAKKNV